MRISSNIPSYKPSYSAATLPQPQAQEAQNEPTFAGEGVKKTGTNWKKQVATLGLMTLAGFTEQANAASVPGRVSGTRSSSATAHNPTSLIEIPGVNLNANHNLPPADPMALMPEAVKAHGKKQEQAKAEQKKAEAKKLEQKEEDKKAEAKYFAQKNALAKRDGDASKVCKAPDGTVVIASWWSTTGMSAHG